MSIYARNKTREHKCMKCFKKYQNFSRKAMGRYEDVLWK